MISMLGAPIVEPEDAWKSYADSVVDTLPYISDIGTWHLDSDFEEGFARGETLARIAMEIAKQKRDPLIVCLLMGRIVRVGALSATAAGALVTLSCRAYAGSHH